MVADAPPGVGPVILIELQRRNHGGRRGSGGRLRFPSGIDRRDAEHAESAVGRVFWRRGTALCMALDHARALELISTGREIDASAMNKYGFVQGLHPKGTVKHAVQAMAQTIGRNGPLATRGAKRFLRERRAPGFAEARVLSVELRRSLEFSEDVDEGMTAHKKGRLAAFKGR